MSKLEERLPDEEAQRLLYAERLAVAARLAAGVSHELNNPLAYMLGNLRFVIDELDALLPKDDRSEELHRALAEALHGAERIRAVVHELRAFTRPPANGPSTVDLCPILAFSLSMAQSELPPSAAVVMDLPSELRARGDEALLGQVFLNLLVNAAQSFGPDASIRHEVRVVARTSEAWVEIEIADDGCGMAPEVSARAFEPFFTTRPLGRGNGLGLSTARAVITHLGGQISLKSQLGQGTTVTVRLPK